MIYSRIWTVLLLIPAFCTACTKEGKTPVEQDTYEYPILSDKTALIVIAPADFQDLELSGTQAELRQAGVRMTIASTVTDKVTGMSGTKVTPDTTIAASDGAAYDAVVFIGGSGTTALVEDPEAYALADEAYSAGKLVAAICMAPEILANAGLLDGKKAVSWASGHDTLEAGGATVVDAPVVTDGRIITGSGPDAATAFGRAIIEYLASEAGDARINDIQNNEVL